MKYDKFFFVALVGFVLLVSLFSARPAQAILGDVNGDSLVTYHDAVYFANYLFWGGAPPVVRNDADLDHCPGVNRGDLHHLVCKVYDFFEDVQLFPPVGTDLIVPSGIKITTGWLKGEQAGDTLVLPIKIKTTNEPDLYALNIPLSYQHLSGQTDLKYIGVDFTGTLLEGQGCVCNFDSVNKKVLMHVGNYDECIIPSGSDGVIARIKFQVVAEGDYTEITLTHFPPEHTPLFLSAPYYQAEDPVGRVLLPEFSVHYVGDVNCDGQVNMADVVYLINYILYSGPPPCDP